MRSERLRRAVPKEKPPVTYDLGEVVTLRAPRGKRHVLVHAPDGLALNVPVTNGEARLWLAQAGTWRYSWGDDLHELQVVEPAPASEPARRYTGPGA